MRQLRIALRLVLMQIRSQMEYRGAFWIDRIAQIITYSSSLAVIWLLVDRFTELAGWRWPDLLLLYSFHVLGYAAGAAISFTQMRDLEERVRLGTFDALLTKPISPWLYIVFSGFNIGYAGHILLGVVLMVWALWIAPVDWSLLTIAYLIASLLSAAMVTAAFLTIIGLTALIWVRSNHLYSIFFGFWELTRYPLDIFPVGIQGVMLTIVPLAFTSSVPVAVVLGKQVPLLGDWAPALALLAGPFFVALAVLCWREAVNRYQGAGG